MEHHRSGTCGRGRTHDGKSLRNRSRRADVDGRKAADSIRSGGGSFHSRKRRRCRRAPPQALRQQRSVAAPCAFRPLPLPGVTKAMNLASNTASVSSVPSVPGCSHVPAHRMLTQRWTFVTVRPVFRSCPVRLSASVARSSWTMRLSLRSPDSASPRFCFYSRISAASSGPMMSLASDPPMNQRRSGFCGGGSVVS